MPRDSADQLAHQPQRVPLRGRSYPSNREMETIVGSANDTTLLLVDGAARLGILAIACTSLVRSEALLATTAAAAMVAIVCVGIVGTIFHECVHLNYGLPLPAQRTVGLFSGAPLGLSFDWWEMKHRRLHHAYLGDQEMDADIDFGKVFRVKATQPWGRLHRLQPYSLYLVLPLTGLNMLRPIEGSRFERWGATNPQMAAIYSKKYLPFLIFWSPMIIWETPIFGAAKVLLVIIFAGIFGGLVAQLQHNTAQSNQEPSDSQDRLTTDTCVDNRIWWWITGSQSIHTAHHMYPRLNYLEVRRATKYLLGHDKERIWSTHETISGAILSLHRHLKLLSVEPRKAND